jgi:hypothetical protein
MLAVVALMLALRRPAKAARRLPALAAPAWALTLSLPALPGPRLVPPCRCGGV